jgi:hypothetical protein
MEVHERAEGLNGEDAAGRGFIAEKGAVGLEDGLPGERGQLVEQVAVEAKEENSDIPERNSQGNRGCSRGRCL